MIFLTVGTANKGFDRLIQKCDDLSEKLNIRFFAQIGSSQYTPKHINYKRWLTKEEINLKYEEATAFIVHGGFGTLSEVLRFHKPIMVVPRTFENGEAVNDQTEISLKLASLNYVKCILNLNDLDSLLLDAGLITLKRYDLVSDIPILLKNAIDLIKR